mmetsp:Transcript_145887/g.406345  ORF Transcript_145887/g.406345 Transcript_145887/m.406345 type:complete len:279 (+) Transcript_145887:69-905(+)
MAPPELYAPPGLPLQTSLVWRARCRCRLASSSHAPWKPTGTRRGTRSRATGTSEKARASKTAKSVLSPCGPNRNVARNPSSLGSPVPVGLGMKIGSPPIHPAGYRSSPAARFSFMSHFVMPMKSKSSPEVTLARLVYPKRAKPWPTRSSRIRENSPWCFPSGSTSLISDTWLDRRSRRSSPMCHRSQQPSSTEPWRSEAKPSGAQRTSTCPSSSSQAWSGWTQANALGGWNHLTSATEEALRGTTAMLVWCVLSNEKGLPPLTTFSGEKRTEESMTMA